MKHSEGTETMDPLSIGLLVAMGAGAAAAVARWRRARDPKSPRNEESPRHRRSPSLVGGEHRVGDVLLYMGEEYWLAGELCLTRDGSAALRLYAAPEHGKDRWLAFPHTGDSAFVLHTDEALAAMGWPGTEISWKGMVLRPVEQGPCAITPSGELQQRWEGLGRYAIYRAMEHAAVVVERSGQRLALTGKAIPRQLLEKLG